MRREETLPATPSAYCTWASFYLLFTNKAATVSLHAHPSNATTRKQMDYGLSNSAKKGLPDYFWRR